MPAPSSNHTSYAEKLTSGVSKKVWCIRVLTIFPLLTLLVAMFICRTGSAHNFWLGATLGMLIGAVLQSFMVSDLQMKHTGQPSDVDNVRVTP